MKPFELAFFIGLAATMPANAQDVRITTFKEASTFTLNGQTFTIERNQDTENVLQGEFARTSRQCPPFCVQPMTIAEGVTTVGELELLEFLETTASDGRGILVDSRLPEWVAQGTIPGSVNIPFMTLDEDNRFRDDILRALGAEADENGEMDFTNAMELLVFSNGPWSEQAPRALRSLVAAGYPADKLSFYRGGMQSWSQLGLTIHTTQTEG